MASAAPLPSVDPTIPPRFHEIGEYKFQRLVTELLALEPEITTSDEYGQRGQEDFGADIIARRRGGDKEIGSCKCTQTTSPAKVRDWSDEFLDHWDDHWKDQNIRRFVLATAAENVAHRKVQDQVSEEIKRFAALGIDYELWGPAAMVAKIRPHRNIAATYLEEYWATRICGPLPQTVLNTGSNAAIVSAAMIRQLAEMQGQLSAKALQAVERAHEDLRSGRFGAVRILIAEQRQKENWDVLEPHTQARLLRLDASLAIRDTDLDRATALAKEADAIAPADEPRLAAMLAAERTSAAAALLILGEVSSIAGLQLRTSLRAMAGDLPGAQEDLKRILVEAADDPETIRMEALVALASRQPQQALAHVQRAEALAPDWNAIRQIGGITRYACALSPALDPAWYMAPNAFDGTFVREDVASQTMLQEALQRFDRLVASEPAVFHHRLWRLAILASIRDARDRAHSEAEALLESSNYNPSVVAWCLFRSINIDLSKCELVLAERYRSGANAASVQVLGLLLIRSDDYAAAAKLLEEGLEAQEPEGQKEASAWIARLKGSDDASFVHGERDMQYSALSRVQEGGDATFAIERLASLLTEAAPNPEGLTLAEGLAMLGRYDLLSPHIDALCLFETGSAIRLAVATAYKTNQPQRTLALIEKYGPAFGEALPPEMRRLRADAFVRAGKVPEALREADVIATSGKAGDRLFRAELLARATGNIRGGVPAVRAALDEGNLTGEDAYRWFRFMRTEDRSLAQRLLATAIQSGVDDDHVTAALIDAMSMQLVDLAEPLRQRVLNRARSGAKEVRLLTQEELDSGPAGAKAEADEKRQMFLDGAVPVHLYLAHDAAAFALQYLGPNLKRDGSLCPWPIRHGARPAAVEYALPWSSWQLHLDITGLLVATRLDLLDVIEAHPNGIALPADIPIILMAMEGACHERVNPLVADRILDAKIVPAGMDDARPVLVVGEQEAPEQTAEAPPAFVSLPDLVQSLLDRSALCITDANYIREACVVREGGAVPPDGALLLLDSLSLWRFAAFDALGVLATLYDLRCHGTDLDLAKCVHVEAEQGQTVTRSIANLRQRIATGLETGTYRLLPQAPNPRDKQDADDDTPISRSLSDLISAPAIEGAMAWIDDRMVTGFPTTSTMPIVGVCDVLGALRQEGLLSAAKHSAALNTLRTAGALYIAPSSEEIVSALGHATCRGQSIIETPLLISLRRSLALMARSEKHLAISRPGEHFADRPDEVEPILVPMRLFANCLRDIWSHDKVSFDHRIAMSDWLWLNVRRVHTGRPMPVDEQEATQSFFELVQIGHCLEQAADIGGVWDERKKSRMDYLNWISSRAVQPLIEVDPTFITRLARYLADFYSEMHASYAKSPRKKREQQQLLLAVRAQRLPEPVKDELYKDPRMAPIGSIREEVTIGKAKVDGKTFWQLARKTLKHGKAHLHLSEQAGGPGTIHFQRSDEGIILTGVVEANINDPFIRLAALDGKKRQQGIRAFVEGLGLPRAEAQNVLTKALAAGEFVALNRLLLDAAGRSAKARYDDVATRAARGRSIPRDLFRPAPFLAIMTHLGLDMEQTFFQSLMTSRGPEASQLEPEVLLKTTGIPVLYPHHCFQLIQSEHVSALARTPLALIHLAAAQRANDVSADDLGKTTDRLVAACSEWGDLFCALLNYTHMHLERDADWLKAPRAFALAGLWAHADRMLDLVISGGYSSQKIIDLLQKAGPAIPAINYLSFRQGLADVAWPSSISKDVLLHHATAAIFREDNPADFLPELALQNLLSPQTSITEGGLIPTFDILLRGGDQPNAMGSFLADIATGIDRDNFDIAPIRASLVGVAIDALEADASNLTAWGQVGAVSAGGLSEPHCKRLLQILMIEPGLLVRLAARDPSWPVWQIILEPIAWSAPSEAARLLVDIARNCRELYEHRPIGGPPPIAPEAAADQLLETAIHIAQAAGDDREQLFVDMVDAIGISWPALNPMLRETSGNMNALTPSARCHKVWELHNLLGGR